MKKAEYAVIGGDKRMALLARLLAKNGTCKHYLYETELLPDRISASAVILPVPCSLDGTQINCGTGKYALDDICALVSADTVLGGRIPGNAASVLRARGATVYDLLEDEALLLKNALLTAEGALEILIRETERSIFGANLLILGFGRVGQALARCLVPLGARVFVAARSSAQLSLARCMGCTSLPLNDASLCEKLCAVPWHGALNTVPARIVGHGMLKAFPEGMPYVELASREGVSEAEALLHGLRRINAQGLPGKTAPESAAQIIYERIIDLLER